MSRSGPSGFPSLAAHWRAPRPRAAHGYEEEEASDRPILDARPDTLDFAT
jgi:hypothetical protein